MFGAEDVEERSYARRDGSALCDHRKRGKPALIQVDGGTAVTPDVFDARAYSGSVEIIYIRPGKPVENCFIESLNLKLCDGFLNTHWLESSDDARLPIHAWRDEYDFERPQASLGETAPGRVRRGLRGRTGQSGILTS